jgi:hypothetical protein
MPFPNSPDDLNKDGSISKYEQDLFDWQVRKSQGIFPGPVPWPSKDENVAIDMGKSGLPQGVQGGDYWLKLMQQGAMAPARDNPYSSIIANQTRPAQMALIEQMRAQQAGPSVAGLQAQQALGRNAMSASAAMGRGPLGGLGALGQQAGIGGGIAADAASARAQDALGAQRGMYGIASGMRGQDLRSAQDQAQAGLGMRGLDDTARLGYARSGSQFGNQMDQARVEWIKAQQRLALEKEKRQQQAVQRGASTVAPVYAQGMGG